MSSPAQKIASPQAFIWAVLDKCGGDIEMPALKAAFPHYKENTVQKARDRWLAKQKKPKPPELPAGGELTLDYMKKVVMSELPYAQGKNKLDWARMGVDILKYQQPVAEVKSDEGDFAKLTETLKTLKVPSKYAGASNP
jgi:hypothetical protein